MQTVGVYVERLCVISFVGPTLEESYLSERVLRLKLGHWSLSLRSNT